MEDVVAMVQHVIITITNVSVDNFMQPVVKNTNQELYHRYNLYVK